jgi:hypothetical protein
MITTTSSADRTTRPEQLAPAAKPAARPEAVRTDRISTEQAEFLRAALTRHPEIRPEFVTRGRELAADPSYPSFEVLRNVAGQILSAPDLSEDIS